MGSVKQLAIGEKQKRFCEEFIIDLNATKAAERAGYSKRTAYSQGNRLLKKAEIQAYLQKLRQIQGERVGRTADDVIRRLWEIVEADPTQAFEPDGSPKPPSKFPPGLKAALASVKLGDTFEVKLDSRTKALELLGKHFGQYIERIEAKVDHDAKVTIYIPENGRDTDGSETRETK